jgi:hypothetical protein
MLKFPIHFQLYFVGHQDFKKKKKKKNTGQMDLEQDTLSGPWGLGVLNLMKASFPP